MSIIGRLALHSPVLPASPFARVAQAEMNWSFLEAIVGVSHLSKMTSDS